MRAPYAGITRSGSSGQRPVLCRPLSPAGPSSRVVHCPSHGMPPPCPTCGSARPSIRSSPPCATARWPPRRSTPGWPRTVASSVTSCGFRRGCSRECRGVRPVDHRFSHGAREGLCLVDGDHCPAGMALEPGWASSDEAKKWTWYRTPHCWWPSPDRSNSSMVHRTSVYVPIVGRLRPSVAGAAPASTSRGRPYFGHRQKSGRAGTASVLG